MTAPSAPAPPRLSINRWTCRSTGLQDFLESAASHGIESVGLWRQDVEEVGLEALRRRTDDAGLRVSSLCRGGFFTAADPADRDRALEDNRRAIEEARVLGAATLVLVVGGLSPEDKDVAAARARVAENISTLARYAEEAGVQLVLEPLHPMFAADRAVVSTLDQAREIAEGTGSSAVSVLVDTYHVWWDPSLAGAIDRLAASGRLGGYQVCDWNLPLAAEPLFSRGYMGDGFIDFPAITGMVARAGYTGDIEVEIFREEVWETPVDQVMDRVVERYRELVEPYAG